MSLATYGHKTKRQLPAAPGNAKVCTRCSLWFLAAPRERVCFGCLLPAERAKRGAQATTPARPHKPQKALVKGAPKQAYVDRSELLDRTFNRPIKLHRQMAYEAAACFDGLLPKDAWFTAP